MPLRRDLGDFQTPPELVEEILALLERLGDGRSRVLEPTCGRGHFLTGLLKRPDPPAELWGIETQPEYVAIASEALAGSAAVLTEADVFGVDFARDHRWKTPDSALLVVGNPPWVTAAELGRLDSSNGPARRNFRNLQGLDARTGRSNFDLAEAIWLKLGRELRDQSPTIALLCKLSVARNVLERADREEWPMIAGSFHRIDARRWFGASVESGLFRLKLGPGPTRREIEYFPSLDAPTPSARLGIVDGQVVADLDRFHAHSRFFGACPKVWRQGVKHDAAPVLELTRTDGGWRNGLGEAVDIEPEHLYPLLKAADLARGTIEPSDRALILPQETLGQDTTELERTAPRLWAYLHRHADRFAARRSSIYRDRPAFSIFGVGPYTFSPWKIAVSGLHTSAEFRAIGPFDGRPAVFDDTSYFLPCASAEEAEESASRWNEPEVRELLAALSFPGAKRPITKGLLQRIDPDRRETSVSRPVAVSSDH